MSEKTCDSPSKPGLAIGIDLSGKIAFATLVKAAREKVERIVFGKDSGALAQGGSGSNFLNQNNLEYYQRVNTFNHFFLINSHKGDEGDMSTLARIDRVHS